jgi:CheY-like chemotaxis protein
MKLIVAEDSVVNRKILVNILQRLGFTVAEFENGKLACEAFNKSPADYAAIFSDIMMPEMDGLQFLQAVRSHKSGAQVPFVLLTAVSDKATIEQAKASNVNGYLLKPVAFDKVTKKLQEFFPKIKFPKLAG